MEKWNQVVGPNFFSDVLTHSKLVGSVGKKWVAVGTVYGADLYLAGCLLHDVPVTASGAVLLLAICMAFGAYMGAACSWLIALDIWQTSKPPA